MGVKRPISKVSTCKDFKKCVNDINNKRIVKKQTNFRSKKHKVFTVKTIKLWCLMVMIKKYKMMIKSGHILLDRI